MSDSKPLLTLKAECQGNEITMKRYADGAVSLSADGAENFIYLHAEQVCVLKALLSGEAAS